MTYGAMVRRVLEESEGDVEIANNRLEVMGREMGARMVEEFLAFHAFDPCRTLRDLAEKLLLAFRYFLDVTARAQVLGEGELTIFFNENPLDEHVVLGAAHKGLLYSNMLCGAVAGGLATIGVKARCWFVRDRLTGSRSPGPNYEMRLEIDYPNKGALHMFDDSD